MFVLPPPELTVSGRKRSCGTCGRAGPCCVLTAGLLPPGRGERCTEWRVNVWSCYSRQVTLESSPLTFVLFFFFSKWLSHDSRDVWFRFLELLSCFLDKRVQRAEATGWVGVRGSPRR